MIAAAGQKANKQSWHPASSPPLAGDLKMKKMTILVPVSISSILLSAVVFAATPTSETQGTPATAPNRAEVFAVAACGEPAVSVAAQAQSWQNALGNKRVQDRALVLAKGNAEPGAACVTKGE
jgi:hypothetical protein